MTNRPVTLTDKYDVEQADVFLTGTQALVRLVLMQAALDNQAGLNTAGYVSGYRGSPLGAIDQQFGNAASFLQASNVVFEPGLNEDLAATAVWGSQQAGMYGDGRYDGVFAMWYGKGPGVDRSGDAFRHANMAGSAGKGGVLVLMGDDHVCESSTTAHQSEFALMDALVPTLNPANVSEMITLGLHGFALSRFAGVWCGLKCVKDNVESTASIHSPVDFTALMPDFALPPGGLNIRANDNRHDQEYRMHRYKLEAVKAYVRENDLNHVVIPAKGNRGTAPRLGIISTGKSYMDTLQALQELDLDSDACNQHGITLYKVAMPWPLEPEGIREFAEGLDQLIIVEEKRSLIEFQVKDILYSMESRPEVIGKVDEQGVILLQAEGALNPMNIAEVIGSRVAARTGNNALQARVDDIHHLIHRKRDVLGVQRIPYFCAGCPHNSSTVVPDGSRAYAGIGCHWMVQIMDRKTQGSAQMGGEGANWIGESHFSTTSHLFQNIGDGTYNHSGLLAIRAAIASDTNITFKVLYNDAVAMTGGQTHEGGLSPYDIAAELVSAGVKRLVVVSDQPDALERSRLPDNVAVFDRQNLMQVQTELSAVKGVTALIYEQTCAAEKRRRRKRGTMIDPPRRAFINPEVCEGCGDCGVQSNCVAIAPLETALGRKRQIDQSACNKDFSCLNGFCPSFVVLEGAELVKPSQLSVDIPEVVEPELQVNLDSPYAIALTGVGGTGVVTIGALLGMAAHLEQKGCGIIDMAGLAQKGGAVVSHIKIGATPDSIKAIRIADAGADLLLGCDELVSVEDQILKTLHPERAYAVVNTVERLTGAFTRDPDFKLPISMMRKKVEASVSAGQSVFVDAGGIATGLLGDSIGSNLFMLGVAYQRGLIPLKAQSITEAVALNKVAVEFNQKAFAWGRAWVVDPVNVEKQAGITSVSEHSADQTENGSATQLDSLLADRVERLTQYQSKRYAKKYAQFVARIREMDTIAGQPLTRAVATNLYKLMAYKDEYEVARLYSQPAFRESLESKFTGDYKIKLQLAPPLLSRPDPVNGRVRKREFGPWVLGFFKVLAPCKSLRGTPLDVFGYTQERRLERQLIKQYRETIETQILAQCRVAKDAGTALSKLQANCTDEHLLLSQDNSNAETGGKMAEQRSSVYRELIALAELPETMRGFGHVKLANIEKAQLLEKERVEKLEQLRGLAAGEITPIDLQRSYQRVV